MGSILVLYHSRLAPVRHAIADHLFSFRRYGGRPCIYINMAVRSVPSWIHRLDIDLVVLHTILLSDRWQPDDFRDVVRRMRPVRRVRAPRVAIPQDEFINTDLLVDVLDDLDVNHVFSCAPEEEWATIYGPLVSKGVGFTRVLPGYLEPGTVKRIERLASQVPARDIDIGYRAWKPKPWLGRHGMTKGWIADAVAAEGRRAGLRLDISMEEKDTLLGDAWFSFLLRSRYTIGVESGAGILDRDGTIRACADAYVADHPDVAFEEVEQHCFAGRDGELNLRTVSPRHLEAAATRTPQILVQGTYNGILDAGRHYIPLRADFANLPDIVDDIARGGDHRDLAEQAYSDIVAAGQYGYEAFVSTVLAAVPLKQAGASQRQGILVGGLSAWEHAADRPSWGWVRIRQRVRPVVREVLRRTGLLSTVMNARAARRARRLRAS
ncbi:MAG: hypothetical protein ACRDFZ_01715 [Candidatus Limnocylindria bacterium]